MVAERNDSKILLCIVENAPLYRQALESIFSLSPEFELTGLWSDAETAIREISPVDSRGGTARKCNIGDLPSS
ncbi:MAG TPA: hypothetical protein VGN00_02950 [Puia sp.]|jgi:hypothetical protein